MTAITGTAILGFRGVILIQSMQIYIASNGKMRSTRIATPTNMCKIATEFTGKKYARSRKGLLAAYADMVALKEGKNLAQFGDIHVVNSIVGGVAADLDAP